MSKFVAIVLGCALLAPAAAFGHDALCSPGWYKNHPEEWCTGADLPRCSLTKPYCCAAGPTGLNAMCPIYLDVLWKVEPAFTNYCGVDASPGVCFNEIAALLNTCFYDEATPCPPDENDF